MCEQYNDYPHIFINNALITKYSKVILVKIDYSLAALSLQARFTNTNQVYIYSNQLSTVG